MPLIILGLLVIIGITIYALVRYGQSEDIDTRPVRERYSHVFDKVSEIIDEARDKMQRGADYTVMDDDDGDDDPDPDDPDDDSHVMHFPDDAELEKRKRNIR